MIFPLMDCDLELFTFADNCLRGFKHMKHRVLLFKWDWWRMVFEQRMLHFDWWRIFEMWNFTKVPSFTMFGNKENFRNSSKSKLSCKCITVDTLIWKFCRFGEKLIKHKVGEPYPFGPLSRRPWSIYCIRNITFEKLLLLFLSIAILLCIFFLISFEER